MAPIDASLVCSMRGVVGAELALAGTIQTTVKTLIDYVTRNF
jgi:hypothetical protein